LFCSPKGSPKENFWLPKGGQKGEKLFDN
jgi:hypothetical protein